MNKRARVRLIGVTAIILISVVAIVWGVGAGDGSYSRSVSDVADNAEIAGERVRVTGTVVPGSWDKKSSPMRFDIRDEGETGGPQISVVYYGGVPNTFGDEVTAIITGTINEKGVLESEDMITKCPSKYESATGALTIADLLGQGDAVVGKSVRVTGYVANGSVRPPGGTVRFTITGNGGSGGPTLDVFFDGAVPEGMGDGTQVVLGGLLDESGVFDAVSVSLSDTEQ
ncbi:MAG: cytochrome c maturation protein CcmE [Coriobacteriia bacterium]|nr:cytochrome c maturation protein CcmE [Coriobacteriia bacterium]